MNMAHSDGGGGDGDVCSSSSSSSSNRGGRGGASYCDQEQNNAGVVARITRAHAVTYATVLPHEPLPVPLAKSIPTPLSDISSTSSSFHDNDKHDQEEQNDTLTQFGYVHIQGAFTPKQPADNQQVANKTTENETNHIESIQSQSPRQQQQRNNNDEGENGIAGKTKKQCMCHDITYIEHTVHANLKQLLSSSILWDNPDNGELLHSVKVVSSPSPSTSLSSSTTTTTTTNISRIRLTTSNPYLARTIVSRLRRAGYSPQDLLVAKEHPPPSSALSKIDSSSSYCCPHGCGGRYSGKALQVSQVTPTISTDEDGNDEDGSGDKDENDNDGNSTRWPRAAPPKFRRLMLTTSTNTLRAKGGRTTSTSSLLLSADDEKAVELENRRRMTRYVYVENIIDRTAIAVSTSPIIATAASTATPRSCHDDDDPRDNVTEFVTECLLAFLQGNESTPQSPIVVLLKMSTSSSNSGAMRIGMIEDDIRHAFQDALRDTLHRDLFSPYASSTSISTSATSPSAALNTASHLGVELFLKPVTSKEKGSKRKTDIDSDGGSSSGTNTCQQHHGMYDQLHIGMRSHEDATSLIQLWQGKCITLTIQLPKSLLDLVASSTNQPHKIPTSIAIQTGKLFLDYADQKLPKRSTKKLGRIIKDGSLGDESTHQLLATGFPSCSECISSTDHVHVPGLYLLHDYIDTAEMEQVLLAALAGPHAPWAPPQYTQAGGLIKRRVQHYGYVFDYESSDVLRRDYDDNCSEEKAKHCCPPLPAIRPTRQSVLQMTNEDVEEYITSAVTHVKGWELLAGIIERTRRFDFASMSSSSSPKFHSSPVVDNAEDTVDAGHTRQQHSTVSLEPSATNDTLHHQQPLEQKQEHHQVYPHINQLTINEYTPGQGIGSHVDTETAFDDGLLLITLGGGIVMEFREVVSDNDDDDITANNDEEKWGDTRIKTAERRKKLLYLPPRSLVLLSGDARYKWEHMIVSRMTDTVNGAIIPRKVRVSLTLRTALTRPSTISADGEGRQQRQVQQISLPIYETTNFPPRWGQLSETDTSASADNTVHTAGTVIIERSDLVTPNTESKHVHDVYDAIATQWHHTRGKRGVLWPGATQFLDSLPRGSVVADVGCGDGKYFSAITAASSYVIGMDIS
jgi:alkylated DNA repair dioxygenase AlkB